MLFRSDTPTTHRVFFVLAATYTFKALLELRRGIPADFSWAVCYWLFTMYLWSLRRKWRLADGGSIEAHYTAFDRALHRYQKRFIDASVTTKAMYWGIVVLAALVIYLSFTR
jgi:hypothetical protein